MRSNLSQLISHEIDRSSSFDSIRLKFQLKISQARLFYLESLRSNATGKSNSNTLPLVNTLFADIQHQISREKTELSKIGELLSTFSDREQLKLEISNL
jgi:hypothetical protein